MLYNNDKTRRFNTDICCFANKVDISDPPIKSSVYSEDEFDGIFLIEEKNVKAYMDVFNVQCLRYDKKTKTSVDAVMNYGIVKGRTFDRVLLYPNGPFKSFIEKGIPFSSPEKYYIAITRAKKSNVFVYENFPKEIAFKYKKITYENEQYQFDMIKLILEN